MVSQSTPLPLDLLLILPTLILISACQGIRIEVSMRRSVQIEREQWHEYWMEEGWIFIVLLPSPHGLRLWRLTAFKGHKSVKEGVAAMKCHGL